MDEWMGGWSNQSINQQAVKQTLPHAENRALKTLEISQNIIQESNNRPEEELSCNIEPQGNFALS